MRRATIAEHSSRRLSVGGAGKTRDAARSVDFDALDGTGGAVDAIDQLLIEKEFGDIFGVMEEERREARALSGAPPPRSRRAPPPTPIAVRDRRTSLDHSSPPPPTPVRRGSIFASETVKALTQIGRRRASSSFAEDLIAAADLHSTDDIDEEEEEEEEEEEGEEEEEEEEEGRGGGGGKEGVGEGLEVEMVEQRRRREFSMSGPAPRQAVAPTPSSKPLFRPAAPKLGSIPRLNRKQKLERALQECDDLSERAALYIRDALWERPLRIASSAPGAMRLHRLYYSSGYRVVIMLVLVVWLFLAFLDPPTSASRDEEVIRLGMEASVGVWRDVLITLDVFCVLVVVVDLFIKAYALGWSRFTDWSWIVCPGPKDAHHPLYDAVLLTAQSVGASLLDAVDFACPGFVVEEEEEEEEGGEGDGGEGVGGGGGGMMYPPPHVTHSSTVSPLAPARTRVLSWNSQRDVGGRQPRSWAICWQTCARRWTTRCWCCMEVQRQQRFSSVVSESSSASSVVGSTRHMRRRTSSIPVPPSARTPKPSTASFNPLLASEELEKAVAAAVDARSSGPKKRQRSMVPKRAPRQSILLRLVSREAGGKKQHQAEASRSGFGKSKSATGPFRRDRRDGPSLHGKQSRRPKHSSLVVGTGLRSLAARGQLSDFVGVVIILAVVIDLVIAMTLLAAEQQPPKIRLGTFLRPIFVVLYDDSLRQWSYLLLRLVPKILETVLLITLVLALWAASGVVFFGGIVAYDDPADGRDACCDSFSSAGSALLSVAVLSTTENYPDVAAPARAASPFAAIWFVAFLLVSVFLLANLIAPILFRAFKQFRLELALSVYVQQRRALMAAFTCLSIGGDGRVHYPMFERLVLRIRPDLLQRREAVRLMLRELKHLAAPVAAQEEALARIAESPSSSTPQHPSTPLASLPAGSGLLRGLLRRGGVIPSLTGSRASSVLLSSTGAVVSTPGSAYVPLANLSSYSVRSFHGQLTSSRIAEAQRTTAATLISALTVQVEAEPEEILALLTAPSSSPSPSPSSSSSSSPLSSSAPSTKSTSTTAVGVGASPASPSIMSHAPTTSSTPTTSTILHRSGSARDAPRRKIRELSRMASEKRARGGSQGGKRQSVMGEAIRRPPPSTSASQPHPYPQSSFSSSSARIAAASASIPSNSGGGSGGGGGETHPDALTLYEFLRILNVAGHSYHRVRAERLNAESMIKDAALSHPIVRLLLVIPLAGCIAAALLWSSQPREAVTLGVVLMGVGFLEKVALFLAMGPRLLVRRRAERVDLILLSIAFFLYIIFVLNEEKAGGVFLLALALRAIRIFNLVLPFRRTVLTLLTIQRFLGIALGVIFLLTYFFAAIGTVVFGDKVGRSLDRWEGGCGIDCGQWGESFRIEQCAAVVVDSGSGGSLQRGDVFEDVRGWVDVRDGGYRVHGEDGGGSGWMSDIGSGGVLTLSSCITNVSVVCPRGPNPNTFRPPIPWDVGVSDIAVAVSSTSASSFQGTSANIYPTPSPPPTTRNPSPSSPPTTFCGSRVVFPSPDFLSREGDMETFTSATLALFQVLTTSNWQELLYTYLWSGISPASTVIFFLSFYVLSILFTLELVVAIFLDAFESLQDSVHSSTRSRFLIDRLLPISPKPAKVLGAQDVVYKIKGPDNISSLSTILEHQANAQVAADVSTLM